MPKKIPIIKYMRSNCLAKKQAQIRNPKGMGTGQAGGIKKYSELWSIF